MGVLSLSGGARGPLQLPRSFTLIKNVYKNSEIAETIPPLEAGNNIIADDARKAEAFN